VTRGFSEGSRKKSDKGSYFNMHASQCEEYFK
jgi:hypothetical protein